jgi:hypothetical protein
LDEQRKEETAQEFEPVLAFCGSEWLWVKAMRMTTVADGEK